MIIWLWLGFLAFIFALLALDLGFLNRKPHTISMAESFLWFGFWVTPAVLFNVLVYFMYEYHWFGIGVEIGHNVGGAQAALLFFTGYLVEESLSLDNIFVIALIFSYFRIPGELQHRVLYWGILGALIMRGIMIATGSALIHNFSWTIYLFGGILLLTALRLFFNKEEEVDPNRNVLARFARKLYPLSENLDGQKFFVRMNGQRAMTPLFLVLLLVESSDVIFAVDSIPAIFAITSDPFIVFTSNIFAILGLRSLYFALASIIRKFRYLRISLVFLLAYIGVKMLLSHVYPIPTTVSLLVIIGILAIGVLASVIVTRLEKHRPAPQSDTNQLEQ